MNFPPQLKWRFVLLLSLSSTLLQAQEKAGSATSSAAFSLSQLSVLEQLLLGIGFLVLLAAANSIIRLIFTLMELQKIRLLKQYSPELLEDVGIKQSVASESWWKAAYRRWTNLVPIEKEKDIMLDHDYDGVRELDNSLPPWWLAIFYGTTAFAFVYIYFNHFSSYAVSSREAYAIEVSRAEEQVKAYLATQANAVDESNVVLLAEADALASGKTIYSSRCAVCHGQLGEGGIGPNFTDEYWLHGGSIQDLFKVVKYGVVEKGMQAWKNELLPRQMQEVSSYILSLQGTNPPNQKEAQGERYIPAEQAPAEEKLTEEEDASLSMNR